MMRKYDLGRVPFLVIVTSFLLLSSCTQTVTNRGAWPTSAQEVLYREVEIVQSAYSTILDRYVVPVSSDTLIVRALQGMQGFLGQDALSFSRSPKGLTVSSQGQSIRVQTGQKQAKLRREIARVFSFIIANNPSCDRRALTYDAIRAMVRMDDHSDFMTADDYKEAQKLTQGKTLLETGLDLEKRKGRLVVVGCTDDSPAPRAGITPGDELVSINGKPANDLTIQEAYTLFREAGNNDVTVSIKREELPESLVFKMTPQLVSRQDISHRLLNGHYIYVHVWLFGDKTVVNFDRAVRAREEGSGSEIKGIVLDLRNCPGGVLDQVLELVNRFIKSGLIIALDGRQTMKFEAKGRPTTLNYPLVVLANNFTSAGSEIVAGALQDHGRAIIVGTTTAGNGSIQTIFPLFDGSGLRLTTHMWRLPLGRLVENVGVVPDIDITSGNKIVDAAKTTEKDAVIDVAVQILTIAASGTKEDLMRAAREVNSKRNP